MLHCRAIRTYRGAWSEFAHACSSGFVPKRHLAELWNQRHGAPLKKNTCCGLLLPLTPARASAYPRGGRCCARSGMTDWWGSNQTLAAAGSENDYVPRFREGKIRAVFLCVCCCCSPPRGMKNTQGIPGRRCFNLLGREGVIATCISPKESTSSQRNMGCNV